MAICKITVVSCYVVLFCILGVNSQEIEGNNQNDSKWTNILHLDKGVQLQWDNSDPEWLTMEMSGPVKGYVALGFSPNGAMKGSDIVMGWVDSDGQPQILDLHAIGNIAPILDESQDYQLISGKEEDGRTIIVFRRKWNTCDEDHDMVLGNDTSRLIWAIHDEDPVDKKPKYHKEHRGVKRTFIRSKVKHSLFPDESSNYDPSIQYWDVRMDQNIIDAEDDIYFCKIAKFPASNKKQHLIGYRPLLQKGNEFSIHHIILYECQVPETAGGTAAIFEQYSNQTGGRCYTPNMPPEWGVYCTVIPILWTAGSEGHMFPSNVGNPLGEEHGGATFFMFEIHYDNPGLKAFVDSSGFRLFYTDTLREHDAASLLVGTKVSPFHVVPQFQPSFKTLGYCTGECTAKAIPAEGLTITTVLLHAHRFGRKITLRHIRNGTELPPIAQETHYDFDYQQSRVINPTRKLLPGDELITECVYDTSKKSKPSFGGLGTRDEMCMSFISYYPKIELAECKTQQEFQSFLDGLGVESVEGDILKEIDMPYKPRSDQTIDYNDNPWYLSNSTYADPLNALDAMTIVDSPSRWPTVGDLIKTEIDWVKDGKNIEKKWLEGDQYAFCTGYSKKRIHLDNYIVKFPKYRKYVEPAAPQCISKLREQGFLSANVALNSSPTPLIVVLCLSCLLVKMIKTNS